MTSNSVLIRPAKSEDTPTISRLYRDAYYPSDGGDPRDFYPYPQLFEPTCLDNMIGSAETVWKVAEVDGHVVGTMAAMTNIGNSDDRVAECFGFVVDKQYRQQKIGTRLLTSLCDTLLRKAESQIILAETRTAHPGSMKLVQRVSFLPLGFEPYAHHTPAGLESMVIMGRVSKDAMARRQARLVTSTWALGISLEILSKFHVHPLPAQVAGSNTDHCSPPCGESQVQPTSALTPDSMKIGPAYANRSLVINNVEMVAGSDKPSGISELPRNQAGIISFRRLEGLDSQNRRYRRTTFIAHDGQKEIAYLSCSLDRIDRRLRLLDLRSLIDGVQESLLREALTWFSAEMGAGSRMAVVDVRADRPALHGTLHELGFFPTAYYPALVAEGHTRIDSVQFTWLFGLELESAIDPKFITDLPFINKIGHEY